MLWLVSRPSNHWDVSNERPLILRAKQPGVSRCLVPLVIFQQHSFRLSSTYTETGKAPWLDSMPVDGLIPNMPQSAAGPVILPRPSMRTSD